MKGSSSDVNIIRLIAVTVLAISSTAVMPAAASSIPPDSRVYLSITSGLCPPSLECATVASPSGPLSLPVTTYVDGLNVFTTGADVTAANTMKAVLNGIASFNVVVAINDTYTVHGNAPGPFAVTTTLAATGTFGTVPVDNAFQNVLGFEGLQLEIGTFHPESATDQFRVNPFDDTTFVVESRSGLKGSEPIVEPLSLQVSYTKMVNVGDVFDIGYDFIASIVGAGQMDLSHTGTISFALPDGVFLTSALGNTFGASPVPVPPAVWLFGIGLATLWPVSRQRAVV